MERLWDLGQQHLVAGRYVSARRLLEAAESIAWRAADARTLARLYLSLLETRRQIRQTAAEGTIIIGDWRQARAEREQSRVFLNQAAAGTFLFAGHHPEKMAAGVPYAARRRFACLEGLILLTHRDETRVAALGDATFAGGLSVRWTTDPADLIQPGAEVVVPLPPAGSYQPGHPLHALARESLIVAWEALALKWQARHPLKGDAWEQMAWQRLALRIDPACEPAAMKMIALAEGVERDDVSMK